jgi:hypothetical protein
MVEYLLGPAPVGDKDYRIGSNFWKFYLISTCFTLGEPGFLVKVFRLFRLERIFLVLRVWTQYIGRDVQHLIYWQGQRVCDALWWVFVQFTNSSSMQRGAFYVHAFYIIPFCSRLFCQVQTSILVFLNSTLPNLKVGIHIFLDLTIWLFCQIHSIWFAKSTLLNCKVHIPASCTPKLPTPHCYLASLQNCQVHFTLCTAKMSFKLPTNF